MSSRILAAAAAALITVSLLASAGCSSTAAAGAAGPAAAPAGDSAAAFCASLQGLRSAAAPQAGESGADALKRVAGAWAQLAAIAPSDVQAPVATIAKAYQDQASGAVAPAAAAAGMKEPIKVLQDWAKQHPSCLAAATG